MAETVFGGIGKTNMYDCENCAPDTRWTRRCPKTEMLDDAQQKVLKTLYAHPKSWEADAEHPEACPVLLLEDGEIVELFNDHREFSDGHLKVAPAVIDAQPHRWLRYMREIGAVYASAAEKD